MHLTGMMNQVPHALVHVDHYLVAIAEGDISLAKIVTAYAEGRLSKTPSALHTRFTAPIADFAKPAKVRAFALGPFPDATDSVVAGFVSGALAVEFEQEELRLTAKGIGIWSNDDRRLESHLWSWLGDILKTPELRALGWGQPLQVSPVECRIFEGEPDMSECVTGGSWNSAQIAQATRRITSSTMSEIVEGTASPDSSDTKATKTGTTGVPSR